MIAPQDHSALVTKRNQIQIRCCEKCHALKRSVVFFCQVNVKDEIKGLGNEKFEKIKQSKDFHEYL